MHNVVSIKGNLTRDPELRYSGETAICKFGIALNEVWGRGNDKQERVHFFDCVAFNKTGEFVNEYFSKGKPILIQGSLSYDSWEDRETGKTRSKVEIKVFAVEFAGGERTDGGGQRQQSSGRQQSRGRQDEQRRDDRHDGRDAPAQGGGGGYDFDDIPF